MERYEPGVSGGRIAYEHLHRYALCREWVAGHRILDLACGAGYGSRILAEQAVHVTAIDIDADAVAAASKNFPAPNLQFSREDALDLSFDDDSFDVVVALEMLEHLTEQSRLLREIRRVLKPDGILLVSTPNKPVYNRYKTPNPYHPLELDQTEFESLLDRHFTHRQLIGARMALVSVSFDLHPQSLANDASVRSYLGEWCEGDRPRADPMQPILDCPEYFLAICSDEPIPGAGAATSLLVSRTDDLWLEHEKIMAWASQLHDEDELLRADLTVAQTNLQRAEQNTGDLQRSVITAEEQAADARRVVDGVLSMRNETRETKDAFLRATEERADAAVATARSELALIARLSARLNGGNVATDQHGIVEALVLGREQLAVQTVQLARLATLEPQLGELEKERDALRERGSMLFAELNDTKREGAWLSKQLERDGHKREALERELDVVRRTLVDARQEVAETADKAARSEERRAAEAEKTIEGARHEAAALRHSLEAMRNRLSEVEPAAREIAEARVELSTARRAIVEQADARATAERALLQLHGTRRRAAQGRDFAMVHTRIQGALAAATLEVQTKLAPPRTARLSVKQRLGPVIGVAVRPPTPIFDRSWLERQRPEEAPISWTRYIRNHALHRLDPHPLFSVAHYRAQLPADRRDRVQPLLDYMQTGWREGRSPHPYFANDWYLARYPDVLEAGVNPLEHYLLHGAAEGRWPNPLFDPSQYLARNPDVAREGVNALVHYVAYGPGEGRQVTLAGIDPAAASRVTGAATDPMAYLLSESVVRLPEESDYSATGVAAGTVTLDPGHTTPAVLAPTPWPPERLDDYWLPAAMREYLLETRNETVLALIWYFYSLIARYEGRGGEFASSAECAQVVARCRQRAARPTTTPRVSIIVPVYDNVLDTLACLATLLEDAADTSFEIVVADDGSTDATAELVTAIGGCVRHYRQPKNVGFLLNCNTAAGTTRGEIVVLLNNDTMVLPGWLDALVAPFDRPGKVGLVGSKLLNWDGTLQEAGGIFWNDGSAWNFGRDQNAHAPQFNYLKDVDYCSGAAIAVPRTLWNTLGGFDPLYVPAYCEDADLAFRIRAAGYRTLYQPMSEVIHHEGRSHGRNVTQGIKAHQVTNQARLLDRWRDLLQRDHFPNAVNVFRARDRSIRKPHILVVDHYIPQPDRDAGSRSIFQMMKTLVEMGFGVTFWPENLYRDPAYVGLLQQAEVEVIYGSAHVGRFAEFMQERRGLYDAALLCRPHVAAKFIDVLEGTPEITRLFWGVDLHFCRMASGEGSGADIDEINRMRELELDICRRVDTPLYPAEEEAALLRNDHGIASARAIPAYAFVVENAGVVRRRIVQRASRLTRTLLFVGGFGHPPNREGIVWFVNEVLPRLNADEARFHVKIVGSTPPRDVLDLQSAHVEICGFVADDDLSQMYGQVDIAIAPLLHGGGVKGKVIEAMARGVPVVTTPIGAQGLPDTADRLIGIAIDAASFASAIVDTISDPAATVDRTERALMFVTQNYSSAAIAEVFRSVLPRITALQEFNSQ